MQASKLSIYVIGAVFFIAALVGAFLLGRDGFLASLPPLPKGYVSGTVATSTPAGTQFGRITSTTGSQFSIDGPNGPVQVTLDPSATIENDSGDTKTAASLTVGTLIFIGSSTPLVNGSVTAYTIRILPPPPPTK